MKKKIVAVISLLLIIFGLSFKLFNSLDSHQCNSIEKTDNLVELAGTSDDPEIGKDEGVGVKPTSEGVGETSSY